MMRRGTPCADGVLSQGRTPLFFCEKQTVDRIFSASRSIGKAAMWCNGSACSASEDA
jgi:hypothetical protein